MTHFKMAEYKEWYKKFDERNERIMHADQYGHAVLAGRLSAELAAIALGIASGNEHTTGRDAAKRTLESVENDLERIVAKPKV